MSSNQLDFLIKFSKENDWLIFDVLHVLGFNMSLYGDEPIFYKNFKNFIKNSESIFKDLYSSQKDVLSQNIYKSIAIHFDLINQLNLDYLKNKYIEQVDFYNSNKLDLDLSELFRIDKENLFDKSTLNLCREMSFSISALNSLKVDIDKNSINEFVNFLQSFIDNHKEMPMKLK